MHLFDSSLRSPADISIKIDLYSPPYLAVIEKSERYMTAQHIFKTQSLHRQLHDIAVANMDLPQNYLLQSMEEAIGIEVDPSVKPEDRPEMFILTSKMKINGATVIFSEEVRQKVGKQIGGDYYLLPSSIHEWVVIPKRCARSTQEMEDMVQEVNEDAVEEEEFLSNHVYEYDVARAQMRQAVTRAVLM